MRRKNRERGKGKECVDAVIGKEKKKKEEGGGGGGGGGEQHKARYCVYPSVSSDN